jgi:hypothetical protein
MEICVGTGFSRSRMARLAGRVDELKLEALEEVAGLAERIDSALKR